MSRVILYKCLLCEKAYTSKQALRGHLRVHRGEFVKTSMRLPVRVYSEFKRLCDKHNTTTCHVMAAMMEMWIKGEAAGVVNLSSPNPVVLQMNQYFLGRPRSSLKTILEALPEIPARLPSCPNLSWVNFPRLEAYCRRRGDVVGLAFCLGCDGRWGEFQVDLS